MMKEELDHCLKCRRTEDEAKLIKLYEAETDHPYYFCHKCGEEALKNKSAFKIPLSCPSASADDASHDMVYGYYKESKYCSHCRIREDELLKACAERGMKSRWEFVEYRFTLEQIAEDCHKIEALLKKKIQGKNWTLDEATTYGLAQFNLKKQYLPALYRTIYKMAKRGAGDGYVRPFDIMMNKVMELI